MAGSFEADIARFVEHFQGSVDGAVRHTVVLVSQGVIVTSPVLSGRFRSNWQVGKEPPLGTLASVDLSRDGIDTQDRNDRLTKGLRAGGNVWVVNNLPYAGKLEYGHSQKSPRGMVRITLANIPAAIERYIQDLQ